MPRITVKLTSPPDGRSGSVGYRGQDEYSRRWIGGYFKTDCIEEKRVPELLRACGTFAHVVEVLPDRDTPPKLPECTEY